MVDEYTTRKVTSLHELEPGDHLRVPVFGNKTGFASTSNIGGSKRAYTHHVMVVRVIDEYTIRVIHKMRDGVSEEEIQYRPEDITVLVYESKYTGQLAIQNARKLMDETYNVLISNCEHFVFEARTGKKQGEQVSAAVIGGLVEGCYGARLGSIKGKYKGASVFGSLNIPGAKTAGGAIGFLFGAAVGAGRGAKEGIIAGLSEINT